MRILLAPDKFKGTFTAPEAAQALSTRLKGLEPTWETILCPLADGGEGTLGALLATGGKRSSGRTLDARLRPLSAEYIWKEEGGAETVFLESASCLGLARLPSTLRDPLQAGSFGLGSLLAHALRRHPSRSILALGGVATVDGGLGFLQALGAVFTTQEGTLPPLATGADLGRVVSADLFPAREALRRIRLEGWCDVLSPLLGPTGASRMFGPQKGASAEAVETLEEGMASFADVLEEESGRPLRDHPGAGAAGGLGLAVLALTGDLRSGAEAVAEAVGLEEKIKSCDAVVTGEGRLDDSTRQGKAPWGVLQTARRLGKPCYVVAGCIEGGAGDFEGSVALFPEPLGERAVEQIEMDRAWDGAAERLRDLLKGR